MRDGEGLGWLGITFIYVRVSVFRPRIVLPPVRVMPMMPISSLPTSHSHTLLRPFPGKGRLVDKATYQHSYPFCWRSDTPLIYKAVPSWFVAVQVKLKIN